MEVYHAKALTKALRKSRGQSSVDYALLSLVIALVIGSSWQVLSNAVGKSYDKVQEGSTPGSDDLVPDIGGGSGDDPADPPLVGGSDGMLGGNPEEEP